MDTELAGALLHLRGEEMGELMELAAFDIANDPVYSPRNRQVDDSKRRRYRSVFLSDIHLGTRACRAQDLLDFLREHEANTIYLVGDIIDFWSLNRGIYWPETHNTVVQKILKQARHDVEVVFVPGNHEYFTPGASGYYKYFGAAAGDPTQGWYSYDLGAWHIVALNSNCGAIGGCALGSPENTWLQIGRAHV